MRRIPILLCGVALPAIFLMVGCAGGATRIRAGMKWCYSNAIHEACGTLAKGTVKNELGKLRRAGLVEDTGEIEPSGKIVIVTPTYRG
jgi:hypothetical protein